MRRFLLLLLFTTISSITVLGQSRSDVHGIVTDSSDVGLPGATVVLMQRADSVMVSYGITDADGAFRLRRVAPGDYLLQITFVGMELYMQDLTVDDARVDVGRIAMEEAVAELDQLVISADRIPMVISGDTLSYNAAAFGVRPNANVEELLRRLPGVDVGRDGSIRAHGEEVEQVLVDGKEFFGNDPTIATRNLPADAVDQVQVYDKQSEMAEFTGVDDGEEQRTINLALKEDRRRGYFGNVSGGYGRDVDADRYEGRANINRFSPTTQLSFLGNLNNVNTQGFSTGQSLQFMGGLQGMGSGGGFVLGGLPGQDRGGDGFTRTAVGGLNFNHDFGSRTTWRSSYFYNGIDNDQNRSVLQQQLAGATLSAQLAQQAVQATTTNNHRLNLNVRHQLAKGHDVRLRANVQATGATGANDSWRETRNAAGQLANTSQTTYTSDAQEWGGDATLTYRKRLGSSGTSLVAETTARFNQGDADGVLNATNAFFDAGDILTSEELQQLQQQQSDLLTTRAQVSLTQPFGSRASLQVRAEHRSILEDQDKSFFDTLGGTVVRNDLLSSALDRTYAYVQGGATARFNRKRQALSLGATVQQSRLEGVIQRSDAAVERSFVHVLPSAGLDLAFPNGASLDLSYATATREPSMRELQPFTDNTDPVNTYTGNPDLTPEYRHTAGLHFMFYDRFTFTNLFAFARATYTTNAIVRSRSVDAQFRQSSTSVNAGDAWTLSGSINFGTPIRPLGLRLNLSNNVAYNRSDEWINGAANQARILRNTIDLRLENRAKDRFDVMAGTRLAYNDSRYSLNPGLGQHYLNRTFYAQVAWTPNDVWRVATELDYRVFAEDVFGDGQRIPLWQIDVSRSLLRQKAEIQLVALDLLDQNLGVSYTNEPTYIQETRVNTLGRYLMLKFVYNLSGNQGSSGGSGIRMIGN